MLCGNKGFGEILEDDLPGKLAFLRIVQHFMLEFPGCVAVSQREPGLSWALSFLREALPAGSHLQSNQP